MKTHSFRPADFIGSILGSAIIGLGLLLFLLRPDSHDFALIIIGAGAGAIISEILGLGEKHRAEARYRDLLRTTLSTLSGTARQGLRIGTAMADMLHNIELPTLKEQRYLLANATALGTETAFRQLIDARPRTHEMVQDVILYVRGYRGSRVADGVKIGFRLQMIANSLERIDADESATSVFLDNVDQIKQRALDRFPLAEPFYNWIDKNLNLTALSKTGQIAAIRQTLNILWQSRHLQPTVDACGCTQPPCDKRLNMLHEIQRRPLVGNRNVPTEFSKTLAEREMDIRKNDLEDILNYSQPIDVGKL